MVEIVVEGPQACIKTFVEGAKGKDLESLWEVWGSQRVEEGVNLTSCRRGG